VYSGAGLLLYMSNQVADDLNYERYELGNHSSKIAFPQYDEFISNSQSLIFTVEYLNKIAELYNYDLSVIEKFILITTDPKLVDDDPDGADDGHLPSFRHE